MNTKELQAAGMMPTCDPFDWDTVDCLVELGKEIGKIPRFCDSWCEQQAGYRLRGLGICTEETWLERATRQGRRDEFLREEEARLDKQNGTLFGIGGAGI